jgi:hypothetical protein
MARSRIIWLSTLVLFATLTAPAVAQKGRPHAGVVYVTGQGLYYDTFVSAEVLPNQGPFQQIANGMTEFGPGDPGYLGGRWWEDLNGNGMQDDSDHYFLCPLLGPGRAQP